MIDLNLKQKPKRESIQTEEIVMGFIAAAIWLTIVLGIVRAL